jgi:hypothetical protein
MITLSLRHSMVRKDIGNPRVGLCWIKTGKPVDSSKVGLISETSFSNMVVIDQGKD